MADVVEERARCLQQLPQVVRLRLVVRLWLVPAGRAKAPRQPQGEPPAVQGLDLPIAKVGASQSPRGATCRRRT